MQLSKYKTILGWLTIFMIIVFSPQVSKFFKVNIPDSILAIMVMVVIVVIYSDRIAKST